MATGHLKWFDPRSGYGFVIPDGSDLECLFLWSDCHVMHSTPLEQGARVSFDAHESEKGWRASNVRLLAAGGACPCCGRHA